MGYGLDCFLAGSSDFLKVSSHCTLPRKSVAHNPTQLVISTLLYGLDKLDLTFTFFFQDVAISRRSQASCFSAKLDNPRLVVASCLAYRHDSNSRQKREHMYFQKPQTIPLTKHSKSSWLCVCFHSWQAPRGENHQHSHMYMFSDSHHTDFSSSPRDALVSVMKNDL